MVQSDALSRRPDFVPDNDTDNDDMTMLPEKLFINFLSTLIYKTGLRTAKRLTKMQLML